VDARTVTLTLAATLLGGTSPSSATTWHILPDGSGDAPTIEAGIDAAALADTVLVGCGTYYEFNIIMKDGIVLRSETGLPDCVTIDAQNLGYILACSLMSNPTVIEGLTLTGGLRPGQGGAMLCNYASPTITRCVFFGNSATLGGALVCRNDAAPIVSGCDFIDNSADQGGAVYVHLNAAPTFDTCTFSGNAATGTSGSYPDGSGGAILFWGPTQSMILGCTFSNNLSAGDHGGGAVFCWSATPSFSYCTFTGNTALTAGAVRLVTDSHATFMQCDFQGNIAVPFSGGAVNLWQSSPTLDRCTFVQNVTGVDGHGGALSCWGGSSPLVDSCVFSENSAGFGGGAVHFESPSSPSLTGCVLTDNSAQFGGGLYCWGGTSPTVQGCTFVRNAAIRGDQLGGGIACFENSSVTVENTMIVFSPEGDAIRCVSGASATLACSDVYGNNAGDWIGCISAQYGINGNFAADPLLCDLAGGDFRLRPESPCAPPGVTGCGLVGALPVGCDPVALESLSWGGIKTLYR